MYYKIQNACRLNRYKNCTLMHRFAKRQMLLPAWCLKITNLPKTRVSCPYKISLYPLFHVLSLVHVWHCEVVLCVENWCMVSSYPNESKKDILNWLVVHPFIFYKMFEHSYAAGTVNSDCSVDACQSTSTIVQN